LFPTLLPILFLTRKSKNADSSLALALGSASLFGQGLVVTQFGLRDMTPALGVTFSMPMAALVFWSSAPFFADFSGWDGDAVLLFAVVGIFFPGMITLLTFEANRRMGPYVTGAIGNLAPLFPLLRHLLSSAKRWTFCHGLRLWLSWAESPVCRCADNGRAVPGGAGSLRCHWGRRCVGGSGRPR
jgi:drug/metabolite transporter (DMT)-like permease